MKKKTKNQLENELLTAINNDEVEEVNRIYREILEVGFGIKTFDKFKNFYYSYKVKKLNERNYRD